ncbi:MAG: nicotinate-nicotinamide nucleotide adenylyltransferase [Deltaproteobacteria bacterium]|nr:nicotinate-nicotinamide nucleotide adenylyltransferase [Deltaproteobacteria bacterium]
MGEFKGAIKGAPKTFQKKVGILGGSFNPPHLGHVAIARHVLDELFVDEVWVIPCFEHPFDKELAPFEERFKMCQLAFPSEEFGETVQVLDLEKKMGGKSYTLRTIQHLQKENPDCTFSLIVGEDAADEAKSWHQYEELKKKVAWNIVPRGEGSPIPNVSATEIRKAIQEGQNLENHLPTAVLGYLQKHPIYARHG